jgi:hypothetical protein
MILTTRRRLRAIIAFLLLLASAGPAYATSIAPRQPHHQASRRHPAGLGRQLDLFAPRVRRSLAVYLRLRMLELREEDLDRARLAIERRLSIDDLLAGPPRKRLPPPQEAAETKRP